LIIFSEYATSHAFSPVRKIAASNKLNSSFGFVKSQIYGNMFIFLAFFIISLICIIGYSVAGFIGLSWTALGLLCTPVTLGAINLFGGITHDAHFLGKISKLAEINIGNIFNIAWAARNYSVYVMLINNCGIFVVNLIAVGAILVLTKITGVLVWDSYVIFGLLVGSGLAYYLKGSSIYGHNKVATSVILDNANKTGYESIVKLFDSKFSLVIPLVVFNIFLCTGIIIVLGVLFGGQAIIGYVLGLNIVGAHISMLALITGS